jgi:hypothetical protein
MSTSHEAPCYAVVCLLVVGTVTLSTRAIYMGESNENRKTEIKIWNIAPLSYELADMLPML